jgi:hypothetical protein
VLLLLILPSASADAVSRLGGLYFYDPLSFDAGLLQQGVEVMGGGDGEAGLLEIGGEVPFYRELSVRVGYRQGFRPGFDNAHRLSWRLRAPIIQSLRYASARTWQFYYLGGITLSEAADPHDPAHEAGGARGVGSGRLSRHLQAAAITRTDAQAGEGGARAGLSVRQATILQLRHPPAGPRGRWTTTASILEVSWQHYGGFPRRDGRLDLSPMAPAAHYTHGRTTWTVGAWPRLRVAYTETGTASDWGGYAGLSVTSLSRPE